MLLAQGRDGTSLFERYHPFSQKPKEVEKEEGNEGGTFPGEILVQLSTQPSLPPSLPPPLRSSRSTSLTIPVVHVNQPSSSKNLPTLHPHPPPSPFPQEVLKKRCGAALEAGGSASNAMPWSYFIFGTLLPPPLRTSLPTSLPPPLFPFFPPSFLFPSPSCPPRRARHSDTHISLLSHEK